MTDGGAREDGRIRFSVCIATVRPTSLAEAVASVCSQSFQDWELMVIGQGDERSLRAAVAAGAAGDSRVHYIHSEQRGLSRARNMALRHATGDVIAFVDDDCVAESGWLEALDAAFDDDVGFACGTVIAPSDATGWLTFCPSVQPADVVFDPALGDVPEGFALLGANIALRRADGLRVGGFDEHMGAGSTFQGGEEHDFVRRLSLLDVRMRGVPGAVVHHTYGARSGLKALLAYKRERVRGDGAFAAKNTMVETPANSLAVRQAVVQFGRVLVRSTGYLRLPMSSYRIFHYLASYRECLRDFGLSGSDPATVSLRRKDAAEARGLVAGIATPSLGARPDEAPLHG